MILEASWKAEVSAMHSFFEMLETRVKLRLSCERTFPLTFFKLGWIVQDPLLRFLFAYQEFGICGLQACFLLEGDRDLPVFIISS